MIELLSVLVFIFVICALVFALLNVQNANR